MKNFLAAFGAFWLIFILAGALNLVEFRVYAGEAPIPKYFCEADS